MATTRVPRHTRGVMNKTERLYSQELDRRSKTGQWIEWKFESVKLRLPGHNIHYTPDFLVLTAAAFDCDHLQVEFHEVKGFMREDAWIKVKAAAQAYPWWKFYIIRRIKGRWESELVKRREE